LKYFSVVASRSFSLAVELLVYGSQIIAVLYILESLFGTDALYKLHFYILLHLQ